jgi:hypothetical protein
MVGMVGSQPTVSTSPRGRRRSSNRAKGPRRPSMKKKT